MRVTNGNHDKPLDATDTDYTAFVDSSSTTTFLPKYVMDKILPAFPSAKPYEGKNDEYFDERAIPKQYSVDCSVADEAGSIDFLFGKTTIKMPYKDAVVKMGSGTCVLNLAESPESKCPLFQPDSIVTNSFISVESARLSGRQFFAERISRH